MEIDSDRVEKRKMLEIFMGIENSNLLEKKLKHPMENENENSDGVEKTKMLGKLGMDTHMDIENVNLDLLEKEPKHHMDNENENSDGVVKMKMPEKLSMETYIDIENANSDMLEKKLKQPMDNENANSDLLEKKLKHPVDNKMWNPKHPMEDVNASSDLLEKQRAFLKTRMAKIEYVFTDSSDDYDSDADRQERMAKYKYYFRVKWDGLSTPNICVYTGDLLFASIPIVSQQPLPMELYDSYLDANMYSDSKESFDRYIKNLAKMHIRMVYEDLKPDLCLEIARLALAFFKEKQNDDYVYVKRVKSVPVIAQCFGIHLIFVARLRDDRSIRHRFFAHLATGEPPVVLNCRILSKTDSGYGKRIPCDYCDGRSVQSVDVVD